MPLLVGVYALAATNDHFWRYASALTWYALVGCALLEVALRRGWRVVSGLFLSLAVLHLLVVAPEIYLRLASFRYEPGITFGGERHPSRFVRLVEDEGLFWTLPPDSPGVSPQGFRTLPLPRPEAPPGLVRVVFLGDSLAHQGYPEIVETLLNTRPDESRRYEVLNLSLAGYSSYQGRTVVERYGEAMAAGVAVIGYGWNDHWLAWGVPDGERAVRVSRSGARRWARAIYRRSRLAQAVRYLSERTPPRESFRLRVPPEDFRANLAFLGGYWKARGGRPLFLTLPSSHGSLGVPAYLVEHGFARDPASVLELHRAYNGIIREVASEHGWPVLDLAAELGALPDEDLERIFLDDGIHLTPAGLALFAERVTAAIAGLTARKTDSRGP